MKEWKNESERERERRRGEERERVLINWFIWLIGSLVSLQTSIQCFSVISHIFWDETEGKLFVELVLLILKSTSTSTTIIRNRNYKLETWEKKKNKKMVFLICCLYIEFYILWLNELDNL